MTPSTLRSIEGFGVPIMVVVTIIMGAVIMSRQFTAYQASVDSRITGVESSISELSKSVERLSNILGNQGRKYNAFDRASCQELMMALKIKNPTMDLVDCYNLPSAQRYIAGAG